MKIFMILFLSSCSPLYKCTQIIESNNICVYEFKGKEYFWLKGECGIFEVGQKINHPNK